MYVPAAFREERQPVLFDWIQQHPLATLISDADGVLQANALPFLLDREAGANGTLRAHLARANPQCQALALAAAQQRPCLVLFQGPQAYVSPGWYASKAVNHQVVPTWNYQSVQARGVPRLIDDRDWLLAQIEALTQQQEAGMAQPWSVRDAPATFIDAMLRAIVGVEIQIDQLQGKSKVSQNRNQLDREGVVAGLRANEQEAMAEAVVQSLETGAG